MKLALLMTAAVFVIAACQKQIERQVVIWSSHGSSTPPALFDSAEFSQIDRSVLVSDELVVFSKQRWQGVPIESGSLQRVKSSDGKLLYGKASFKTSPSNESLPAPHELEKLQTQRSLFLENLKKRKIFFTHREILGNPELSLLQFRGRIVPAYSIESLDEKKSIAYRTWFSPQYIFLKEEIISSDFDIQAWVYALEGQNALQEVIFRNLIEKTHLKTSTHQVQSQAPEKIQMGADPLQFTKEDPRFDQVHAFYFVQKALDFFTNELKVSLPIFIDVETSVGYPQATNAAFTYQNKIRLGAGDQVVYRSMAQDPSVVIHEVGHILNSQLAHLPTQGEGGSLNEGFADFFAASLLNSPKMGQVSFVKGPYKRNLEEGFHFEERTGGLYHDSLIVSGTLWSLRSQLGSSLSQQLALRTLSRLGPAQQLSEFVPAIKNAAEGFLNEDQKLVLLNTLKEKKWPD